MSSANTLILVKKSGVTGNTPVDLEVGELALNYADNKLFYKDGLGIISSIQNQNTFETINVNSTLIVASNPTDIFSIQSGTNISIDTDVVNKKITINSTGGGGGGTSYTSNGSLLTSSTDSNQILDSFSASTYRTVKYVIQAISGSNIHSCDVILTHNDTDTFASQYGVVKSSGTNLFTLGSTITEGTVQLLITPTNAATQIDFLRTSIIARTLPVT